MCSFLFSCDRNNVSTAFPLLPLPRKKSFFFFFLYPFVLVQRFASGREFFFPFFFGKDVDLPPPPTCFPLFRSSNYWITVKFPLFPSRSEGRAALFSSVFISILGKRFVRPLFFFPPFSESLILLECSFYFRNDPARHPAINSRFFSSLFPSPPLPFEKEVQGMSLISSFFPPSFCNFDFFSPPLLFS